MKPCWYINPLGEKCRNEGILVPVIEDMIFEEIKKYKDSFLSDIQEETDSAHYLETLTNFFEFKQHVKKLLY